MRHLFKLIQILVLVPLTALWSAWVYMTAWNLAISPAFQVEKLVLTQGLVISLIIYSLTLKLTYKVDTDDKDSASQTWGEIFERVFEDLSGEKIAKAATKEFFLDGMILLYAGIVSRFL